MPPEAFSTILNTGAVGAMLIATTGLLLYLVRLGIKTYDKTVTAQAESHKRFVDFMETLVAHQREERAQENERHAVEEATSHRLIEEQATLLRELQQVIGRFTQENADQHKALLESIRELYSRTSVLYPGAP